MNQAETKRILWTLRTEWQNEAIDEPRVALWTRLFADVPYAVVEDAVLRWMQTGKFFPKPAELRELIGVAVVAPNLIPEAAWAEVLSEARRVGFNRLPRWGTVDGMFQQLAPETPQFSSPLIADAVAAVGWELICTGDDDKGFIRGQFVKTLAALMQRAVRSVQTGGLPDAVAVGSNGAAVLPERVEP